MPFVEAEDGPLYYTIDGPNSAPALLLANSLGTTHEMWDGQIPALAERFRVLRYDMRGHVGSTISPGPYDIAQLGRDALAVLDAEEVTSARFCGLSLGGMVGMWLGVHAPARIERLVLANTSARIGAPEIWNERIATVERDGMAVIVGGVIDRWFTKRFQAAVPAEVERVRKMLLACSPNGYAACAAAVRDGDQLEALHGITASTCVIAGREDTATTVEHARAIAERIRGATLVELDAAHLSNIEQADAFTAQLLRFF